MTVPKFELIVIIISKYRIDLQQKYFKSEMRAPVNLKTAK